VLVLRNNNFHGPIWLYGKFFGFKKLRIMDLSFNNFDGDLSSEYFRNWSALNTEIPSANKSKLRYMGDVDNYYQDTMNLTNKGLEMVLKKILTTLSSIDISYNNFHGEIPSSLGDLKSLKVLNLSRNNFEGLIPSSLGKLSELESLDLSKNNLVGTIPQQLKDLNFLAFLNLSDNQLKGQIPQGGQFNTFQNSSFGGNLDLCGFPLSKKCERTPTPELESSESKNGFGWKTVVMGYGCGLVIGVTIEQVVALRRPNLFARIYT
ncbi:LRR domain containing protein, partial [Trema orientale]